MADQQVVESGMYRDVMAQPDCWEHLLARGHEEWRAMFGAGRQGLLVGMGSSYYAALAAQFALARRGGRWWPMTSDDALHYLPAPPERAVVISQSGESADTVAAADRLRAAGARITSVTNTPGSRLARLADHTLDLGCGPEAGSSTKTYTSSVLALLLAAFDGEPWLEGLAPHAQAILRDVHTLDSSLLFSPEGSHYFLGVGPNYATALEAALLCKEKLYLDAHGASAADFLHGWIEALDERSTVWLFPSAGRVKDLFLPLARRVARTGARIVCIGEGTERLARGDMNPVLRYPVELDGPEEAGTLLFILPIQMMVVHEAARRGLPIDTFRRMGKVMTGYDYGL